ncbi:MAG: DUF2063 domain-containing protein [Rhodanobacteraceae bacterium]|nr:MAG: DUF2063 domain-containing protein [Rhodanobacteraceae bacterium]
MPTAPSLLECQRRFMAALYAPDAAGPVAAIAGNGLEPAARLRIYRHSSEAIHAGALRTTYPAVLALVGEAFFEQCVRDYRRGRPSRAGNLQGFGQHFVEYLATLSETHTLPYLPDVARLEWLRQETALAADAEALSANALAHTSPVIEGIPQIALHPSVRLLASAHAVLTIWRYAMQPGDGRLQLPYTGENVVSWREAGEVAMAALDAASFACIEMLACGHTLENANAAARAADPAFDLAACLASFAVRGLLVAHPSGLRVTESRTCP